MAEQDVLDLLVAQHARIRDMFDEVGNAEPGARGEAFDRLVRLLAAHETAEEEIVHPYARLKLDGGHGLVAARLDEERRAKRLLQHLDRTGVAHPDFHDNLDRLRRAVTVHARSEERYEFVRLRAATTAVERRTMAVAVRAAEALAPTHPHPGTESATRNLLLGGPLALVDRARDLIRKATDGHHA
ncbi:hemerythrin domain-containing protein [Nonomuraea pusilla]|uniref:hemerythrin domain-containing protein n=1 Tax=Nonomuraea pusilla TaxID=46177 RepID=UPI00332C8638